MYLKSLHLSNFRNYAEQSVDFTSAKTILLGNNAQGKSNLLEAVELLSALKSHRTSRDRDFVLDGETAASIVGQLAKQSGNVELALTLRQSGRRSVSQNGLGMRRQLDFLGTLNMVQFSCLDLDLVRGGPDERRRWLDGLLVQLEPIYAYVLQQYVQVLKQRNALLKKMQKALLKRDRLALDAEAPPAMPSLQELALWDAQLAVAGVRVMRRRARAIARLAPIAEAWHRSISGNTETLTIRYLPNVPLETDVPERIQAAFLEKIEARTMAERYQGSSMVGPHRDEVDFTINGTPARQYGSQGQQRTLVLALKLAELKLIEEVIGEPPLLLLDDVLAELDLSRQNQLLEAIQDRFQTLITTTHLGSFDSQWLNSSQILYVDSGSLLTQEEWVEQF
ncbi:DNA replication/repair protein RecF [filamentous cyanobacterium LEGE 11480]|uniref:DNA replication and repair protein RecF n=1 Tax=Romeriopsis navalis LEGE 11480 TaxID=2777977 RepID=A0A928Z170_9CYAN|nr:DNA replication/repair protein RecF [Romeriopsis navalis]MBE9028204.1 DNA replication/repair protein RecF [Romeriopsis navalis LEGE 11480]